MSPSSDTGAPAPRGALLVGSVPLADAEQVFRVAARELGDHLRRIPDGETGERSGWVAWQGPNFKLPGLRLVKPPPGQYPPTPRFAPADASVELSCLEFPALGFADSALAGHAVFSALKREGILHPDTRFQVSLPTPLAPVAMFIVDEHRAAVAPVYEQAMRRELDLILERIPPTELAIQWDICVEVWMWERWLSCPYADPETALTAGVARAGGWIPPEVELGHHYCYGDFRHEHFHQPRDASVMVAMANRMVRATVAAGAARIVGAAGSAEGALGTDGAAGTAEGAGRTVDWVHLPVPIDRTDDAFYAPLDELDLPSRTEVHLGLVHIRDGVPGARARIERALAHLPTFGVACECGMGRRPPGRGGDEAGVVELLRTHAAVSAPVR